VEQCRKLVRGRIGSGESAELERFGDLRWQLRIDGGLHASEVAHAQHTPELAWRVATEESEEMRRIRRDVVLVLPSSSLLETQERLQNFMRNRGGIPGITQQPQRTGETQGAPRGDQGAAGGRRPAGSQRPAGGQP